MSNRPRCQAGFTLIELLVVIIIIAILAAIAIPVYLGQRQKAEDSAAKSVVRNAMIAVESAYTDAGDFTAITEEALAAIEPSIQCIDAANAATAPTADAEASAVNWHATDAESYELGSLSHSGHTFGVAVDKGADGGNTFYINGAVHAW